MMGRTLGHFTPHAGASGDMVLAAAIDAGASLERVRAVLDHLPLPGWGFTPRQVRRGAQRALLAGIVTHHQSSARSWTDVHRLIAQAKIPEQVKRRSLATFERLAIAEAKVHDVQPAEVNFHEVGGVDSIVDIVGACAALQDLDCASWTSSPVSVGSGEFRMSHGRLPAPSPATLELLRGRPTRFTDVPAELCTPTGAALLVEWVDSWGPPEDLTIHDVGYGAGARELEDRPNVLRLVVGAASRSRAKSETLVELRTLVDDLSPEQLSEALKEARTLGALDAYSVAAATKKSRTAAEITCLTRPEDADVVERLLFLACGTLGIRRTTVERKALQRSFQTVDVSGEDVTIKIGWLDGEAVTAAPEHDDCRRAAIRLGLTTRQVHEFARAQYWASRPLPGPHAPKYTLPQT